MANQKTRKVLDIRAEGRRFVCIRDNVSLTYKLYEVWMGTNRYGYPAEKRKLLAQFAMFFSVIDYIRAFALDNNWGF